jgi:hypothetical protein
MNDEYVELFEIIPDKPVPYFIGTYANWEKGIEEAAKHPRIEICVYDHDTNTSLVVYSDDANMFSGGWWAEQVHNARRFYGMC